jgi:hypothetical protein
MVSKIISAIQSTTLSLDKLYSDNKVLVNEYGALYKRVKNRILYFRNVINALLSYSCIYVDNGFANQDLNSSVGKIGKYITLPFFIDAVKLYNGNISINEYSSGDIIFSNAGSITELPLNMLPSVKISSNSPEITYRANLSLDGSVNSNAFYCKSNQDVGSISVVFSLNGKTVYTESTKSNEVFFSFDQITFDVVTLEVGLKNTNTSKPVVLQIDDILIFEDIQFSQFGSFESKSINIGQTKNLSTISISYLKNGYSTDKISTLLAISASDLIKDFSGVSPGDKIDISYYKFKRTFQFNDTELVDKTIEGTLVNTLPINNYDIKWGMNYKNAVVAYGLSNDYLNFENISSSERFNNWNKVGNYYVTSLINYYDNVYVNIGTLKCTINGKEVGPGSIKIPIGISSIQVHSKDISFESVNLFSQVDTLDPYNFAYIFSGLPVYNNGAISQEDRKIREFDISSTGTIELGTPFIPLTEIVTDSFGNTYNVSLSPVSATEGTYTIEPYTGRITINPLTNVKLVTVSYIAAQSDRRPVGILFNRLLTFTEVSNTVLNGGDNVLFSFDGNSIDSRYIILPKITNPIKKSQILYNLDTDEVFTSVKIDFTTDNKYKTPAISDIYLSVG